MVAAAGLPFALHLLRRSNSREFGKVFEERYVEKAKAVLEADGWRVQPGYRLRRGGDVDLLLSKQRTTVAVEIKSFIRWGSFFMFRGKREQKAVNQALNQCQQTNADIGIIWLPQGRPRLLQQLFGYFMGRRLRLVCGNEYALKKALPR